MRRFHNLAFAAGLLALHATSAQTYPLWRGLDAGAHAVGFKSFWRRDWSRGWTPAVDETGNPVHAPPARPVRMNVWYPAARGGTAMTMRDYIDPARTAGFEAEERRLVSTDVGDGVQPGFRRIVGAQQLFDALLDTRVAARREAPSARGRFPIIVYSLGQGDYTQEDIPFCEYLASRGFIVVSVPSLGTSPRRNVMFIHDPPSYDAQVSDLAFALATVIREVPGADSSRVGAVGMSMGGVYATLLALRTSTVRVVVGRDPSILAANSPYMYRYWEAPEFDAARFRGHMLLVYRKEPQLREHIVDSLRYADRQLLRIPYTVHTDYTGYPEYSWRWPDAAIDSFALARRSREQALNAYTATTRYVGCYLDAVLTHRQPDASACQPVPGAEVERLAASRHLTEEELYDAMRLRGLSNALQELHRHTAPALRRNVMTRIANELGYAGRPREEAEYSELMTVVFPDADAFEHAGDTWTRVQEVARARAAFERALSLDPSRTTARDKLAKLGKG